MADRKRRRGEPALHINWERAVEKWRNELICAVQQAVRIRSVQETAEPGKPFGAGPARALEHALTVAANLGFHCCNLDGYIGYAEYRVGDEYVASIGHLDTVPPGDGWAGDPFAGRIENGRIFGRGAFDNKGPALASLFALKMLLEAGGKPQKSVRIIFGLNEESGSSDIQHYLAKETGPLSAFTPDGAFPAIFAEKGSASFVLKTTWPDSADCVKLVELFGGERSNVVPDACCAVVQPFLIDEWLKICRVQSEKLAITADVKRVGAAVCIAVKGIAAHGSRPEKGRNAVVELLKLLERCPFGERERQIFGKLANEVGGTVDGDGLGIAYHDERLGGLTINAAVLRLVDKELSLKCNVRYPAGCDWKERWAKIQEWSAANQMTVCCSSSTAPLYFEPENPLLKALLASYRECRNDFSEPLAIGGGTYAKFFPNTIAFGPHFPATAGGRPHRANEYIEIEELVECAKIYAKAFQRMTCLK